ncbi:MAG: hypothetical protein IPJ32_16245 [Sphingobacteriaceae bacterium]|nr:hypothetical protein [Sphingobacteriaceae bacterium]
MEQAMQVSFSINNSTSTSRVIEASTTGLGNVFAATITNSLSTSSLFSGATNGTSGLFISNSNPTGIGGSFNTIGTAVFGSNSGPYHTIQAQNTSTATGTYAGDFTGGVNVRGKTNTSAAHALKVLDNGFTDLFSVRNDGNVGVGTASPGAKLDISPSVTYTGNVVAINNPNTANTNAALYLSSAGTGGGMQVINSNASSSAGNFYNTNASSTSAAFVIQNNGPGNGLDIYNVGGGRALSASNTATLPTGFFNNSGNGYAVYAQNSTAVASRAGFFIGGLDIMGKTTGSTTFPLVVTNSGSTNLFNVRDDGNVGIGVSNPGYRLAVLSTNSLSAIYGSNTFGVATANVNGVSGLTANSHSLSAGVFGQTTGANSAGVLGESTSGGPSVFGMKNNTTGNAGRFEVFSSANTADAIFASNTGTAAVIHTKNNTNAASGHLGILIEDGHIGTEITTALPTASVNNSACTACTAGSGTVMPHSTDVAGTITFNMTGNYPANFDFTVNYAKPYRKIPVVTITPANIVGGNVGKIYVQNLGVVGNYTGFRVFFIGGISGGAGTPQFNYMVIEGAN